MSSIVLVSRASGTSASPHHQRRLHGLVLREDERLRKDAADERLEPAEPELRIRGQHDTRIEPRRREAPGDAHPARGELLRSQAIAVRAAVGDTHGRKIRMRRTPGEVQGDLALSRGQRRRRLDKAFVRETRSCSFGGFRYRYSRWPLSPCFSSLRDHLAGWKEGSSGSASPPSYATRVGGSDS
jgi:hypothetical protein